MRTALNGILFILFKFTSFQFSLDYKYLMKTLVSAEQIYIIRIINTHVSSSTSYNCKVFVYNKLRLLQ